MSRLHSFEYVVLLLFALLIVGTTGRVLLTELRYRRRERRQDRFRRWSEIQMKSEDPTDREEAAKYLVRVLHDPYFDYEGPWNDA